MFHKFRQINARITFTNSRMKQDKMNPKFTTRKPDAPTNPNAPGRADSGQAPDTPTSRRGTHHRRALSETFFRFPDIGDDDIFFDGALADLNLDFSETAPTLFPDKTVEAKPLAHLRSLSVDSEFFDGLGLDGGGGPPPATRPRHKRSSSVDEDSSGTSCEAESSAKKAMTADRLKELALIDPKRAKRVLANRQSAARSKERKTHYTSELERKVQTLQNEATTLSTRITVVQRDANGLSSENKELKLKLQALEQQAHLRDALNDALKNEVQWLKLTAGQALGRGTSLPSHYFANQYQQQPFQMTQTSPSNPGSSGQPQPSFENFNPRS